MYVYIYIYIYIDYALIHEHTHTHTHTHIYICDDSCEYIYSSVCMCLNLRLSVTRVYTPVKTQGKILNARQWLPRYSDMSTPSCHVSISDVCSSYTIHPFFLRGTPEIVTYLSSRPGNGVLIWFLSIFKDGKPLTPRKQEKLTTFLS